MTGSQRDVPSGTIRNALAVIFATTGMAFASWTTRVPDLQTSINASLGEFGLLLFFLPAGSVVGTQLSAVVSSRMPSHVVLYTGTTGICSALVVIGSADVLASPVVLAGGLLLLGLSFGASDVALNLSGAAVESTLGRSVLPLLHGMFSVGSVIGAGVGVAAVTLDVAVSAHLSASALICLVSALTAIRRLPAGKRGGARQSRRRTRGWDWRTAALVLVAFGSAFAEGAANGWLVITLVQGLSAAPTLATVVFALFLGTLALARILAVRLVDRWGGALVLAVAAAAGVTGILLFVLGVAYPLGAALWGIGVALGLPLSASAAGAGPDHWAAVARVTALGYVGYLAAPVAVGLVADAAGILPAVGLVAVPLLAVALLAPAMRNRSGQGVKR